MIAAAMVLAAMLAGQGDVGTLAAIPTGWRWYTNVRFGFAVCYPPGMRLGRESDNGDGAWITGGRAEIIASGINAMPGDTLESDARDSEAQLHPEVYRRRKADWLVYTGRSGGDVVWVKTFLNHGRFASVRITYPAAAESRYSSVVARLSACFRAGKPAF